jgi:hypothetical protein
MRSLWYILNCAILQNSIGDQHVLGLVWYLQRAIFGGVRICFLLTSAQVESILFCIRVAISFDNLEDLSEASVN